MIARSEDDPMLSLDARLSSDVPERGFLLRRSVRRPLLHAGAGLLSPEDRSPMRSSSQIFPLGGKRGEQSGRSRFGAMKKKPISRQQRHLRAFVNLPGRLALPLPFAIGDYPEVQEPVSAPLQVPVTVNGRLRKPAEVDKYELAVISR